MIKHTLVLYYEVMTMIMEKRHSPFPNHYNTTVHEQKIHKFSGFTKDLLSLIALKTVYIKFLDVMIAELKLYLASHQISVGVLQYWELLIFDL